MSLSCWHERDARHKYLRFSSWSEKESPGNLDLPEHFKNNGYYTASYGKVYHHYEDNAQAWDSLWRIKDLMTPRDYITEENIMRDSTAGMKALPFENPDVEDNAYRDGKLAEGTVNSLKELAKQDQPFFLAVGLWKPHLPFNAPKKYWDMYDPEKINVPQAGFKPANAPDVAFHNSGELKKYLETPRAEPVSEEMARKLIHGYYASVSYIDAQIGKIMAELENSGLDENTIVVLWGDHGWNLREHGMWCKHCNFKTSLHSQLVIKMPGFQPLQTKEIVEFVDIYPTLSDLTGLEKPDHLEGKSMVNLMKDADAKSDGVAISKWFDGVTTITEDYFYTEWVDDNDNVYNRMLYNHNIDPDEMNNLSEDPSYKSIIDSLSKIQRQHRGENFWQPSVAE